LTLSRLKAISVIMLLVFASVSWADSEHVLRIQDRRNLNIMDKAASPVDKLDFKSDVSEKNLLGLERKTPYSLPLLSPSAASITKTLRILGIRVEFQEEIPDDPRTTGNGLFDMRDTTEFKQKEGHLIDPSPHDTLYFKAHLQALNNYWWTVSQGRLALEGEVYPKSETLAYRLPHPMAYYGAPDSSLSVKVEMLRRFFHDSFNLADSLSGHGDPQIYHIDFSQYDCFVIFHAGSDLQSDLGELVNPTPGDLFTGFIVLGDTVWVNGGTFPITEGTFIPETRSQDNRVSALNGVFAHEFGHQLGLVDLYNTNNFMTQVGDFSLMDNNAQNVGVYVEQYGVYVSGVLPVYPDAWSRAYLGFVQPEEIENQNDIKLFSAEESTDQLQVIKLSISPEEYFLIENRQQDLDGDHSSALRADSLTNVILGPINMDRQHNREYDWLLPGSGILIWHVDEGVAYLDYDGNGVNNFWDNQMQCDKDRRFLTIVEADGIIDFGGEYYTGYGIREDMFYRGNNSEFTPNSYPSSKSRNKSDTHIWVTGISYSDTLMTLNVSHQWIQTGFPQKIFPETNISSLVYADVDDNGNTEILASSDSLIYAWGPGGTKLIPNDNLFGIIELNGDTTYLPLAIFAEDDSAFFGPPSLGDLNGDDTLEVVSATVDGRVFAWHPYDRNGDRRADVVDGFPVKLGDRTSMMPVLADFDTNHSDIEVFVGGENGSVKVFGQNGEVEFNREYEEKAVGLTLGDELGSFFILKEDRGRGYIAEESFINPPMPPIHWAEIQATDNSIPISGDINRDGNLEVVLVSGDGQIYAWDSQLNPLPGFPVETNMNMLRANPVLGDLDRNGYLDIVLASQDKIFAYNFNGTLLNNFPVTVSHPGGSTDLIVSSPILGDADGDGFPDIIVGTKNRQILAYNWQGKMVDGFPLPLDGAVTSSPILLNLDEDANAELLTVGDDGFIYAWNLSGEYKEENFPWVMYGYNAGHTDHFPKESLPPIPPVAGNLMPASMAFNYPNPAKDQTKIRYYLKDEAIVNIKVYDLSGRLVDEFIGPGEGRMHNEKIWDCSKFASGVYLCRVEAKSEKENQVVFFKMAVMK
jgi:M6 family metalloprotease-like protein